MPEPASEPATATDERTLVERAQAGDAEAFGRLYELYVDRVYGFVRFRVRDRSLAEDLTQEVFIQAMRGLGSFDWRGSLAPWLLRIARNAVVDHWRRRGRRPERAQTAAEAGEEDEDSLIGRMADEESEREVATAEQALDRARIEEAAEGLTDLQQQVIALRFTAGLSIRETAEVMERSEGAIKNLQHHALRGLKSQLRWHEGEP